MAYRTIPLTRGFVTLVDEADFEWLSQWKWYYSNGYACRKVKTGPTVNGHRQRETLFMHRVILTTPDEMEGEHKDNDGLNNRRYNLRNATPTQNQQNRGNFKGSRSKYKGVDLHKRSGLWRVRIKAGGKRICLGYFRTEEEAALAYDKAAIKHFGDFAQINQLQAA